MVVFSVPTHKHALYQLRQVGYFVRKHVLRRDVVKEELYQKDDAIHEPKYTENGAKQA